MVLRAETPDTPVNRAVVTVKEASQLFECSVGAIYDAVHRGDIPHVRIGRKILIPRVAIDRMLTAGEYEPVSS